VENATEPTGFGLLSLKERACSVGGNLSIESTPGQGSRISLTVPLLLNQPHAIHHSIKETVRIICDPTDNSSDGKNGLRVIFVDDHEVMRQGLIRLVESQTEIQVIGEASNGRQALELARQLQPDVVVMDISMPEMDGIEATSLIKTEFPKIRVIGLSMYEDPQLEKQMREAGASEFLSKTVAPAELIQAICR